METGKPKSLHYKRSHFVTRLPVDYLYSPSHCWIAQQQGYFWRVGFTKFAVRMLGDMVDHGFEAGREVRRCPWLSRDARQDHRQNFGKAKSRRNQMMNAPEAKGQRPEPDSSVASGQLSVAKTTEHRPRTTGTARYIMIGGFLGAGKTTSVVRLAQHLTDQGLKVGLITNDQGSELVDTAMLRSRGFATEEIPGGCFCCRFNTLVDAAHKLT